MKKFYTSFTLISFIYLIIKYPPTFLEELHQSQQHSRSKKRYWRNRNYQKKNNEGTKPADNKEDDKDKENDKK